MSVFFPRDTLVSATDGNIYLLNLALLAVDSEPLLVGDLPLDDIAISPAGVLYGLSDGNIYELNPESNQVGAAYEAILVAELPRAGDRYDFRGMDFNQDGDRLLVSGNVLRDISGQALVGDLRLFSVDPASGSIEIVETLTDVSAEDFSTTFDDLVIASDINQVTLSTTDVLSVQGLRDREDYSVPTSFEGLSFDIDRAALFGFSGDNVYIAFSALSAWQILDNGNSGLSFSGAAYYRPIVSVGPNEAPTIATLNAPTPGIFEPVPLSRLVSIADDDGLDDIYSVRTRLVTDSDSGAIRFNSGTVEDEWVFFRAEPLVTVDELLDDVQLVPFTNTGPVIFEIFVSDQAGESTSTLVDLSTVPLEFPSSLELEYFARQSAYGSGPLATFGATGGVGEVFEGWTVSDVFESGAFRAIALRKAGHYPVLAVRGTTDHPFDWLANTDPEGPGVAEATAAWADGIANWFRDNPYASVTGHSQGGAQAQLFASLAVANGFTVGKVHTFNSPGIDAAAAVSSDAAIWEVVHWVSSDDIVSQAGSAFLPGRVNYYDYSITDDAEVDATDYLDIVTFAHTTHWAQAALYDAGPSSSAEFVGYVDNRESLSYSALITRDSDIESPEFSQLGADPTLDDEIAPTLAYLDSLIDFADPRLVNNEFVYSREGTDLLRTDWAPLLIRAYDALSSARKIGDDALAAVTDTYEGAENAISSFLARFDSNLEPVVVQAGTHAGSNPAIVVPSGAGNQLLQSLSASAMFILGPGAEEVLLSNRDNIVAGGVEDLDASTIFNFTEDDQLVIFDVLLDADMLSVEPGSAILTIDRDRDEVADATISLVGDFDISAFDIDYLSQNTVITYSPPSPSPILRAATIDISVTGGGYFERVGESLRLTADGGSAMLGLLGGEVSAGEAVAQGRYGVLNLDISDGSYDYTLDSIAAANATRPLSELFIVTAQEAGETYYEAILVAEIEDTDYSLVDPSGDAVFFDALLTVRNEPVASAESLQLFRTYSGVFGRTPDAGGFDWWFNRIALGEHDLRSMVAGFLWSAEFLAFFPGAAAPVDISDEDFVTHMYRNVFDRDPDPGGFAFWTGELASGSRSQIDVVVDMTQSNEFIGLTISAAADYLI